MTRQVAVCVMAVALATPALAQPAATRTFTIAEPVLAGGTRLEPGTYEIRLGARAPEGVPQRAVELMAGGEVVARETAEIVSPSDPVATAGTPARVRVEKLKGGEFVRVSFVEGTDRYLIYLPTPP